jgi:hypothetical protein
MEQPNIATANAAAAGAWGVDVQKITTPQPCTPCRPTQPECGKCEYGASPAPATAEEKRTWRKVIAVDFDGCLCANAWPEIGTPNEDVIERLKLAQADGAAIILWTNRAGLALEEALDWCADNGIRLDGVNASLPEWVEHFGSDPRKIGATEYWDDKAVRMPPDPISAGGETLHRALETYGMDSQADMCIEEMAELSKALLKERRAAKLGVYSPELRQAIYEEMADVYITMAQMKIAFEVSGAEVDGWTASKIARLKKQLDKEEATNE